MTRGRLRGDWRAPADACRSGDATPVAVPVPAAPRPRERWGGVGGDTAAWDPAPRPPRELRRWLYALVRDGGDSRRLRLRGGFARARPSDTSSSAESRRFVAPDDRRPPHEVRRVALRGVASAPAPTSAVPLPGAYSEQAKVSGATHTAHAPPPTYHNKPHALASRRLPYHIHCVRGCGRGGAPRLQDATRRGAPCTAGAAGSS